MHRSGQTTTHEAPRAPHVAQHLREHPVVQRSRQQPASTTSPPPHAPANRHATPRGNRIAESEVEGLTSIRYDIVSLLVTGSERALLRRHKNVLNDGR